MAGTWTLQLFLLCLAPALVPAVRINAKGREVIYLAKGDSVKLGCPYELGPEDDGPNSLDIEWTQMNSDPTSLDNVVLSYQGHQVIRPGYRSMPQRGGSASQDLRHFGQPGFQQNVLVGQPNSHHLGSVGSVGDCCRGLQQRVDFVLPDPSQYDASINLQNVQVLDSATYECKVKKSTVATRKVTVTVLERPSVPQCSIVGRVAQGRDITLRCSSQAGSSPLIYQWSKVDNWMPPSITKGPNPGDLVIRNLSSDHVGFYQCSVANKVGSTRCALEVSLAAGAGQLGLILGAVFGSLLLLLLLCLIVGLVCCCKRRRRKVESNRIRVDTAPPRTKSVSRDSSLRSVLGYIPHTLSFMQRRKYESPKEQEGVEMISPARESDNSCAEVSREDQDGSCTSVVTTKARVHYAPTVPSYSQAKAGTSSTPLSTPTNLGSNKPTSDVDSAHGKRSHPGNYGGVPVMVPALSREDLVI